ncbi:MAG: oligosaccharide repeat unit polymerase [Clostridium sp.]|nr:oligosaccharide repeat unit polymerase [Clostridium sp.]
MIVYVLCYGAAWMFAESRHPYLAGLCLLGAALWLYYEDYRRSGNLLHLRALFALSFVGGQGLAALRLSRLSQDWNAMTWLSFLAAFTGFYAVFWYLEGGSGARWNRQRRRADFGDARQPVFMAACILTVLSAGCFAAEAVILGYIPLFVRGVPHAYSYFHLTGIHYVTVSCVLVPSLSVIFFCIDRGRSRTQTRALLALDALALLIPILCVSRSQLLMAVLLAAFTYIQMGERIHLPAFAGAAAALAVAYVAMTAARSHDSAYLKAVFEMKQEKMPLFLSQPYMYVANNYDNFDCLTGQAAGHTWGLRMLAPLWSLSGLKFLYPSLTPGPVFVTRPEMTTLTLIYDAYYDFGLIGVLLFSCALGFVSFVLMRKMEHVRNPILYLLYAQMAFYLLLSFFTTWFSNSATWFYLAVTGAAALYVSFFRGSGLSGIGRRKGGRRFAIKKGALL